MTLKTNGERVAYWTIACIVIVTTLVLSIVYSASTHMKNAIFASGVDGTVYAVETKGTCGKCANDIWYLYDENGEQILKACPLLSEYKFIHIKFNHDHYDQKTKTSTLGSYKDIYHKVLEKDGFYLNEYDDGYNLQIYKELDSGFKGVRCFSLLFWAILTTVLIVLPFIHSAPSKDDLLALMKYAQYVGYNSYKKTCYYKIGNLEVKIDVRPNQIDFNDILYKGNTVSRNVHLFADGHLENIITSEYYWIKKVAKTILPLFSNDMVNLKIEKIL